MRLSRGLILAFLFTCNALPVCLAVSTLTVLPFSESGSRDHRWLGIGIADILTRNMAAFDHFQLLDQGKLQIYLREMELQNSGFTALEDTLRVARVAKVDQILFGNFRVTGKRLEIEARVVNLDDQSIVQSVRVAGELSTLHSLLSNASVLLALNNGIAAGQETIQQLNTRPTDSLSAMEHFYRAMDAQDHGEYETAVSHFIKARQIDARYAEAGLWIGRMFELINFDEHAIVAYDSVNLAHPNDPRGLDANVFASQLMMRKDPQRASARLEAASDKLPWTSHTLETVFLLGQANQLAGNVNAAYSAYAKVLSLTDRLGEHRARETHRQSLFFPWHAVMRRHREANVQMVKLWRDLKPTADGQDLEPPRGTIIADPDSPSFYEQKYATMKPLFMNERPNARWAERFYAVVAPRGYLIDGIELKLRGQLLQQSTAHDYTLRALPFPVPKNFHNSWLGVVYGQTKQTRQLTKTVPFYGRDQEITTLQLIENHGKIFDWGFDLSLKESASTGPFVMTRKEPGLAHHEGFLLGRLELNEQAFSGVTKPLSEHWYEARQSIALSDKNVNGIDILFSQGDLAEGGADLFVSQSTDGQHWQPPSRFPLSSLSNDFSPQILRAENGDLRAFWISNRRGLGWELWTGVRPQVSATWQPAMRIPLEAFSANHTKSSHLATRLLHYGVTQDRRGRWVVAVATQDNARIVLLTSRDSEHWEESGAIVTNFEIVNPTIIVDKSGRYRLTAFSGKKRLHIWTSNDLETWSETNFKVNAYGHIADVAPHKIALRSVRHGLLTALISDTKIGLQYARFDPDTDTPRFDLVRNAALEDYASASFDGHTIVALRRDDAIDFQLYDEFQTHPHKEAPNRGVIYSEHSPGIAGNAWRRIFARWRVIQPDVNAVGVAGDGRVWWGIETGVMTLKEDDFFAVDVADGFFHHHVTTITPCGENTGFASRDLDAPRIGIARPNKKGYSFTSKEIDESSGRITALTCTNNRQIAVGTADGYIALINDTQNSIRHKFANEAITALASNATDDSLLVGTSAGRLSILADDIIDQTTEGLPPGSITAISRDRSGHLWVGVNDGGVFILTNEGWRPAVADLDAAYRSVSHIVPDPVDGVWMTPNSAEASRGLLYADGTTHQFFRPMDHTLFAPTGLGVAPSGNVWVGTAFDGLFEMTRAP